MTSTLSQSLERLGFRIDGLGGNVAGWKLDAGSLSYLLTFPVATSDVPRKWGERIALSVWMEGEEIDVWEGLAKDCPVFFGRFYTSPEC